MHRGLKQGATDCRAVTVKARLIPYHIRPNPPLLASSPILSAYNHANNPASFDMRASARETLAAHQRSHPGVTGDADMAKIKADKAAWNEVVNWVMSERRVEKLRAVEEERSKRLSEVANSGALVEEEGECEDRGKKRKTYVTVPLPSIDSPCGSKAGSPTPSIFGAVTTPRRASPSVNGLIRPATTPRPNSPRRYADKRRSVYNGMGEYSPRGRGSTYTPPRILPSGDETAPFGSPAPTLQKFDFVSPLGPVKLGRLDSSDGIPMRKGSLDVVKEEPQEDGWTVVQSRKTRRAGSAPCRDKAKEMEGEGETGDGMTVDL